MNCDLFSSFLHQMMRRTWIALPVTVAEMPALGGRGVLSGVGKPCYQPPMICRAASRPTSRCFPWNMDGPETHTATPTGLQRTPSPIRLLHRQEAGTWRLTVGSRDQVPSKTSSPQLVSSLLHTFKDFILKKMEVPKTDMILN